MLISTGNADPLVAKQVLAARDNDQLLECLGSSLKAAQTGEWCGGRWAWIG